MTVQPDGEIWLVRDDGRDTNGQCCWKTQNGDGLKLLSKFGTEIPIFWDNGSYQKLVMRDANTFVVNGTNEF